MKKLVLLVVVAIGVVVWQNWEPDPAPTPTPVPSPGRPSPIDAFYDHVNPTGLPPIRPGKTDRQLLGVGGACDDPWVPDALQEVTGIRTLWGKACDPGLYNGARWANYEELKTAIRNRLSDCTDPWVTLAIINSYGRPPMPAECEITRYNGGEWSRYEDLVAAVSSAPPVSFDPTWNVLVLVYDKTAISSYNAMPDQKPASGPPRVTSTMDAATVAHIKDVATRVFPANVRDWSDYRANVNVTMIVSDTPLRTVTYNGDDETGKPSWWVSPRDVAAELDRYAPEGRYDSVVVVTKQWDGAGSVSRQSGGLATGPWRGSKAVDFQDGTHGMSYADIPLGTSERFGGINPAEVFVHEWLHGVEGYWREVGFSNLLPRLHNADDGACRAMLDNAGNWKDSSGAPLYKSGDTWQPFLAMFMKGQVGGTLGVHPGLWPRGGPTKFHPNYYGAYPDPGEWGPSGDEKDC